MKYVFAMIAGGLMVTTSFISGSLIGGWVVHEIEKPIHKKEIKENLED